MVKRVGVFGGSFDPPHLGHKALVEAALAEYPLDDVWVIPVGTPVHRELTPYISAIQRLSWVESMFADMPQVRVLDWEIKKEACPAIETIRDISNQLNTLPYWLLGMDAWRGLPKWIAYPEHQSLCNMIVFSRQGEGMVKHHTWTEKKDFEHSPNAQMGLVYHAKTELPDISATQIRQDILTGKDVSTVLDARIADEIQAAYAMGDYNRHDINSSHGESK